MTAVPPSPPLPPDKPPAQPPATPPKTQSEFFARAADKVRAKFPAAPGVYLFQDQAGRVLYIGKAKDLRARVSHYFLTAAALDQRTSHLVREAYDDPNDPKQSFALVDVRPLMPVRREVSLQQIKAEPRLQHLALVRQSRLSVSPVDEEAWRLICAMAGIEA